LPESTREAHGSATLSCVDLAAAAAFTAARLSLVNVAISARLTSRGHREQWRREERPIVARCLTFSADALSEWWDASVAKQDADSPRTWVDPDWHKGRQLLHDLRFETAQLDLLASRTVRQAARGLEMAHDKELTRLLLLAKPARVPGFRAPYPQVAAIFRKYLQLGQLSACGGRTDEPHELPTEIAGDPAHQRGARDHPLEAGCEHLG
jgi:hypothetical protein